MLLYFVILKKHKQFSSDKIKEELAHYANYIGDVWKQFKMKRKLFSSTRDFSRAVSYATFTREFLSCYNDSKEMAFE